GANSGDFGASGCSGAVSGGNTNNTCTVDVDFTPSATGTRTATLNVAGQQVSLTGNGTDPSAGVSPGSFNFGNQPLHVISQTETITLQNTGNGPLTYSSTGVGGANPGDFSVSDADCAAKVTLAPNASCSITVAFNPTATGARSAVINITDDDPQNGTQSVNVSGTGTPSSVGFSPATVTYTKAIPAGTSSTGHVVTIRNLTSSPMPIVSTALGRHVHRTDPPAQHHVHDPRRVHAVRRRPPHRRALGRRQRGRQPSHPSGDADRQGDGAQEPQ